MVTFNYRRFALFVIVLLLCVVLLGCDSNSSHTPGVLGDITYSSEKDESQYTIFLLEEDVLVPYLVLTDDYEGTGNCLLLRKHILDKTSTYNPNARFSAYYENCVIDQLLNNDFVKIFPSEIMEMIETSTIDITCKESLHGQGDSIKQIERKVFLLSAAEVGNRNARTILKEGNALAYFYDDHQRIAYLSDGSATSWWLRTPNSWYDNVVCGVGDDGIIGIGGVGSFGEDGEYENGVRPAFCLSSDLKVLITDDGYVLAKSEG